MAKKTRKPAKSPKPVEPSHRFWLYFDGACAPNPGGVAAYGWQIIAHNGYVTWQGNGIALEGDGATVNVAEYAGLVNALQAALTHEIDGHVTAIFGDSLLVINQILGKWKVEAPNLIPWAAMARVLFQRMGPTALHHVASEKNRADGLSRLALKGVFV